MVCCDSGITRWSAPKNVLRFPISVDFIKQIRVTYAQGKGADGKPNIVFTKTEADCEFKDNAVSYTLSQEETLGLDPQELVDIQVQGYDRHGAPFVSDIVHRTVIDILNEEVSW